MKPYKIMAMMINILFILTITACAPAPQSTPAPTHTIQSSPTFPPTFTPEPTATLVPTFTPTPLPEVSYLYTWPVPPLTEAQIQEALDCEERTWLELDAFDPAIFQVNNPANACEYTMQAIAMIEDENNLALSEQGTQAAQQALLDNPGIIFSNAYFFSLFYAIDIVAPPPFVYSKLESAAIAYDWTGSGAPVTFKVDITTEGTVIATGMVEKVVASSSNNSNTDSVIQSRQINKEIKMQDFAALGKALGNLIPIPRQNSLPACENTYPDWTVALTYADGHEITLQTNQSTYLVYGGPYQTTIDGQDYILASADINTALYQIIRQLAIELGDPQNVSCNNIPVAEILLGEDTP